MKLIFEWDRIKEQSNFRKHRIAFDEAKTIFRDELVVTYADDFHSDNENRFISIGTSANSRILLVVHTEVDKSANTVVIRIISCRKAKASERKIYEEGK